VPTPVFETDYQDFGRGVDLAPGTRLFFVGDIGANIGSLASAGKVYIYKVN
jgi:hypothetical protein